MTVLNYSKFPSAKNSWLKLTAFLGGNQSSQYGMDLWSPSASKCSLASAPFYTNLNTYIFPPNTKIIIIKQQLINSPNDYNYIYNIYTYMYRERILFVIIPAGDVVAMHNVSFSVTTFSLPFQEIDFLQ